MKKTALVIAMTLTSVTHAYEAQIKKGLLDPTLEAMVGKAKLDTQVNFDIQKDFTLIESRELATSNYLMYVQTLNMIPVASTAVRIWKDKSTGELILGEMHLNEAVKRSEKVLTEKFSRARFSQKALNSQSLSFAVRRMVSSEIARTSTDSKIISMKFKDQWVGEDLVREVEVRSARGVHLVSVSLLKNKIIQKSYREFPKSDSLKANVFPIYEEVEGSGERLPYEVRELKYVDRVVHDGGAGTFGDLEGVQLSESRYSALLAETDLGRLQGYWSEPSVRSKIENTISTLPFRNNDFESGLLLSGKYATINLHPNIKEAFPNVNFSLRSSTHHILSWNLNDEGSYYATPVAGFLGRPLSSQLDLLSRIPMRLPDHDPTTYINSGSDEVQVYYAVTELMDALSEMGFTDPELSTKAFDAFLYDPDISMQNNAYYYDNTINFTTYTPSNPNLARDNPTIWHELGHGVMERLMGVHLSFADSKGGYGGLSEGMADFVAQLVIHHQTQGSSFPGDQNFRIINQTGFYLTNEFHDEGESYGGAMNDMLLSILQGEGQQGLARFTDLTLETMRLTRNHPALTARSWFEHMVYADELGSSVRQQGQYRALIFNSLNKRNFSFSSSFRPAEMNISFAGTELTSSSPASREKPLTPCDSSGFVSYELKLRLKGGDAEFIKFPAVVKVEYRKGALQGAIKWAGEENNPNLYRVNSEDEVLSIPLSASMKCETINQPDGSCKDYAYVQVYNQGDLRPLGKKRFYLKIKDQAVCSR